MAKLHHIDIAAMKALEFGSPPHVLAKLVRLHIQNT
jgi:hypothetical protein